MNTDGYKNMVLYIKDPKLLEYCKKCLLFEPSATDGIGQRQFNGTCKQWRRKLHLFDKVSNEKEAMKVVDDLKKCRSMTRGNLTT